MLSRLFGRAPARPDFPERADLPHLSDQEAEAVLSLLRLMVMRDQADVYTQPYTPEGARPRWNVWDMTSGQGRRVELETWAIGVLFPQCAGDEDPDSPIGGAA